MFKIGAFSKLVHVSARMLRHYEKCGLIQPVHFDRVSGNRYYSASQIPLLYRITTLRDMGFNIAEIGDILDNYEDGSFVESMIALKTSELKGQMLEYQERLDRMENMSSAIVDGTHTEQAEIVTKSIPSYPVLSLRKTLPDYSEQNSLWQQLFAFIEENNLYSVLSGQLLCIYHCEEYVEKNVDIEVCALVKEPVEEKDGFVFRHTDEIPLAASAVFNGFYSNMALWEGTVGLWVEENGYEIAGREQFYCLKHYLNCKDIDQFQTEMQLPIKKLQKGDLQ